MEQNLKGVSGIYVVSLLCDELMPVTRDKRYVNTCARVNKHNIKVGKAKNFHARKMNYWKDFDQENVVFIPLAELQNIQEAETAILRHLKPYRKLSPKGGKMDWLEGIPLDKVIMQTFNALDAENIEYQDLRKKQ